MLSASTTANEWKSGTQRRPRDSASSFQVWEAELRGHAIANGFFVAGVNRVGQELESEYYGASVFIDPIGETIAQAGDKDEALVADLSMERLEAVRRAWPFFRDRRPDTYGRIVQP